MVAASLSTPLWRWTPPLGTGGPLPLPPTSVIAPHPLARLRHLPPPLPRPCPPCGDGSARRSAESSSSPASHSVISPPSNPGGLWKLGPPGKLLEELLSRLTGNGGSPEGERSEIPRAKGLLGAMEGQAFFLPLSELFLTYGGIFCLIFVSKGILAEILDFLIGKDLIPADGEIWRVQRCAISQHCIRTQLFLC